MIMSFSLALQQIFAPNHWNDVPTYDKKLKKQREEAALVILTHNAKFNGGL